MCSMTNAVDAVGDVLETIDDLFEMIVNLGADNIGHRIIVHVCADTRLLQALAIGWWASSSSRLIFSL